MARGIARPPKAKRRRPDAYPVPSRSLALALLLGATALSACSMNPKYERPATPVPPSWPVGDAYLRQSEAALPTVRYSDIFRDARLQQLIVQALANNRDLRIAAANIASTRAQYRIQRANLLPNVSATGRYSYTDRGSGGAGSSAVGEVARAPTPAITVAPGPATAPSVAARVPASAMAVSTPAVEPGASLRVPVAAAAPGRSIWASTRSSWTCSGAFAH